MGACCCKDTASEEGENDRLLVNPVSDDEDYHYQRGGYGTRGDQNGGQPAGQTDLNAAVSQILESVAVQVIDVAGAHASAPALEQQEYLQRSRAFMRAGNEELRGIQQPKRAMPSTAAAATGGGPAALLSGGQCNPADLQLVAGAAQAVAHSVASLNVRPPEDLLVQFGAP